MMKSKLVLLGGVSAILALSGCGALGGDRTAGPVSSRAAPLVVPPDFALSPAPGTVVRSQDGAQDTVLEALFGGPAPRSTTERALATSAGNGEAGIRSSVGDPQTNTVNKGSVTRDIIAAPEGDGQTAQAVIPG